MLRQVCTAKKGVLEDYPFDETTATFKVMGKIFAIADAQDFQSINVKCDPLKALALREQYSAVVPGYHMNKKHWNTLQLDGSLAHHDILEWIDDSYQLVAGKLPRNLKEELETLAPIPYGASSNNTNNS